MDDIQQISVLDTSIAVPNLGHAVIMQAVEQTLRELFPAAFFYHLPVFERLGEQSRTLFEECELAFLAGTPALASKISIRKKGWRLSLRDAGWLSNVVLLGVGWKRQQRPVRPLTRRLYHRALSHDRLHAVRDSHAQAMLERAGFTNVLNTACPTMWHLHAEHCAAIPTARAPAVMLTLNSHHPDRDADRHIIDLLRRRYETVWFFPQQYSDFAYLRSLECHDKVTCLPPRLDAYDATLAAGDIDYVGMRVHGGIRALQHRVRSVILAVDHRAEVMAADTNLPMLPRADGDALDRWIASSEPIHVRLPTDAIERWKAQFH